MSKEALKQEEQTSCDKRGEPVAWRWQMSDVHPHLWEVSEKPHPIALRAEPLYTTPQQRKPLTDEQIWYAMGLNVGPFQKEVTYDFIIRISRAIEAAHGIIKEKNT